LRRCNQSTPPRGARNREPLDPEQCRDSICKECSLVIHYCTSITTRHQSPKDHPSPIFFCLWAATALSHPLGPVVVASGGTVLSSAVLLSSSCQGLGPHSRLRRPRGFARGKLHWQAWQPWQGLGRSFWEGLPNTEDVRGTRRLRQKVSSTVSTKPPWRVCLATICCESPLRVPQSHPLLQR
jgi:hypothetical protein